LYSLKGLEFLTQDPYFADRGTSQIEFALAELFHRNRIYKAHKPYTARNLDAMLQAWEGFANEILSKGFKAELATVVKNYHGWRKHSAQGAEEYAHYACLSQLGKCKGANLAPLQTYTRASRKREARGES
jgi:hypothetical protein